MNDGLAEQVLRVVREHGLTVPEQFSVTGYDDSAGGISVGLTTVHRHFRDLGRTAADLAVRMETIGSPLRGSMVLDPRLVIRRTTGPAPRN